MVCIICFCCFNFHSHTHSFYCSERATKTGGLWNLLYICHKPEPLGMEFKYIVDGTTIRGTILWLQIQEYKHLMCALEYKHNIGGTVMCVMRCVTKISNFAHHWQDEIESVHTPYLFFGDSWFGSIKALSSVILNFLFLVILLVFL